jgi:hypothetical protein
VGDPQGKAWTLAFDDEFNGTSIDTTKWDVFNGVHPNNDVTSAAADCSESGGDLHLDLPGNGTGCNISSAFQPYTGAATGANAWELATGDYVEARVWFASSSATPYDPVANWPGFWTSGVHWPTNGEIDIAEGLAKLTCSYHAPTGTVSPACMPTPFTAWGGSWHVYGAYRTTTHVYVYWDGNLEATIPTTDADGPQAIRFDIGIHTGAPNSVFGSAGDMLVDWVRGWTNG